MSVLVRDLGALAVTATPFLAVALLLDTLLRRREWPHLRLALLGIVRQVAEMGRPEGKKSKR